MLSCCFVRIEMHHFCNYFYQIPGLNGSQLREAVFFQKSNKRICSRDRGIFPNQLKMCTLDTDESKHEVIAIRICPHLLGCQTHCFLQMLEISGIREENLIQSSLGEVIQEVIILLHLNIAGALRHPAGYMSFHSEFAVRLQDAHTLLAIDNIEPAQILNALDRLCQAAVLRYSRYSWHQDSANSELVCAKGLKSYV